MNHYETNLDKNKAKILSNFSLEIEKNSYPKSKTVGEAFLSKRNLFPSIGKSKNTNNFFILNTSL